MPRITLLVRLKGEVLDPAGSAVHDALRRTGFDQVKRVRIGKLIELDLDDVPQKEALASARAMAEALLANPVTEECDIVLGDLASHQLPSE